MRNPSEVNDYKFFGLPYEDVHEFIEAIYEAEVSIDYRQAEYDIWLDGRGYCIGMTSFGTSNVTDEEHSKSVKAYKTPEDLIADYTFYDGTKLCDAMLMYYRDIEK